MKSNRSVVMLYVLVFLAAILSGCALGTQLKTETADPKTIQGTYDLFTYGCRYPDDLEHAAFLIAPEKSNMVELYVPATSYKVKRGLPAEQALAEANAHVRCGVRTVQEIRTHRIPDGAGGTLGYEILPRFVPTDEGGMDPLLVSYSLKAGKVIVYIRLFPDVERKMNKQSHGGGQ
jgi:hypothetical protein